MLWGGWRERKRERAGHASSPARFLFFDYCYFSRDTQRELQRRRENQRRCAFVSVQQKNQIDLFPFDCYSCFGRAFSFQGHTKIILDNHYFSVV